MLDGDQTPSDKTPSPDAAAASTRGLVPGKYGVWLAAGLFQYRGPYGELSGRIEDLGFESLWLGGSWGADLSIIEQLLAGTSRIVVGTSIANIWRDPAEQVAQAYQKLADQYGDRFVLGLGVGHHPQVEYNQNQYSRPLARLGEFLDVLDAAAPPVPLGRRAIAALGPKALELARDRSAGSLPYLTTPEHTAQARAILGDRSFLAPEQKVVLSTDPDQARAAARAVLEHYLELPNYLNSWRRLGFEEADFEAGGSDALIDATFGWGEPATALARVQEHLDAGADQVCIQPVPVAGQEPLDDLAVISRELNLR
jgi:probable F420-dependent oxidoreductase